MSERLHSQTSEAIKSRLSSLSEAIVILQYERQPHYWKPFGKRGWQLAIRDQIFHLSYLIEAITISDPTLFVDYQDLRTSLYLKFKNLYFTKPYAF
jgi:hypothetical protein